MPLWIVATPIGTLGDLSPRAKEVLASAAVILSEDTRMTLKLLSAVGVTCPQLIAVHAHNESDRAEEFARRAITEDVALVTDAGTPGVSDPGRFVVAAAQRLGARILSVPGPSALATALAVSGFPAAPSTFLGFPPRKARDAFAREVLARPEAVVLYEAPDRVADLVASLAALAPDREACLCRELSKLHEEVLMLPLAGLAANLAARDRVRGECVLVVGPGEPLAVAVEPDLVADAGMKDVAQALARRWGVPRQDVYQGLLALKAGLEGGTS